MDRPTVSPVTELVYQEIDPVVRNTDPDTGWSTLNWLEGHMMNLQAIYDIVRDRPEEGDMPGWAIIFDPDNAPANALQYGAQFVGRVQHPYMSEEVMRSQYKNPDFRRGTPPAFMRDIKDLLVGQKRLYLLERAGGSAWQFTVSAFWEDLPETDKLRTNILPNPDADNSTNDMSVLSTGTFTAVANPIVTGGNVSGNVWRHVADGVNQPIVSSLLLAATPGSVWSGYAQMAPTVAGQNFYIKMIFRNASSVIVGSYQSSIKVCGVDTFNPHVLENITAPVGTTTITMMAIADEASIPAAGRITYFDRFRLAPQKDLGGLLYGDGDFAVPPDWVWTWDGAANNSTSHRIQSTILLDRIKKRKPIGMVPTLNIIQGGDYASLLAAHASYQEVFTDFADYQAVLNNPLQT